MGNPTSGAQKDANGLMATFGIWALLMGFSFFETPKGQFENEIGQLKIIHFIGDAKVMWKI